MTAANAEGKSQRRFAKGKSREVKRKLLRIDQGEKTGIEFKALLKTQRSESVNETATQRNR
jgi:hypothetical protein